MKKVTIIVLSILTCLILGSVIFFKVQGSRDTLTIEAKSYECTYDGKEHSVSGFLNESDKGIKASDSLGVTYYITGINSEYSCKNVSDSKEEIEITGEVVVRNKDGEDVTSNFKVDVKKGSLIIKPAKLTLKSKNISKTYDGKPLKNGEKKLDVELGWKASDGATYKFTASQTEIGSTKNTFEIIANDGTDLNNYEIEKTEGKLTVKKREKKIAIKIKAKSLTCTYDGKKHEVEGFENMDGKGRVVVNDEGTTYYVSGLTSKAEGTNVEDSVKNIEIKGTPKVVSADGEDVTEMFSISLYQGSLKIEKADVTLESKSLEKDYDGKELTNGNNPITEKGWVKGEGASYSFTGSQTEPGSSLNSFDYKLDSNTKESNYNITKKEGTLTVNSTQFDVTVRATSYTGTYNGYVQEVSGFENVDGRGYIICEAKGKTFYVTGLSSYYSAVDAIDVSIPVTGSPYVIDENGNDCTDMVNVNIVPGSFVIEPLKITLESKSASKSYDGTPLRCEELTEKEEDQGWIGEDGVEIEFKAAITNRGSIDNKFEFKFKEGTNGNNYDIETKFGKLVIQ